MYLLHMNDAIGWHYVRDGEVVLEELFDDIGNNIYFPDNVYQEVHSRFSRWNMYDKLLQQLYDFCQRNDWNEMTWLRWYTYLNKYHNLGK